MKWKIPLLFYFTLFVVIFDAGAQNLPVREWASPVKSKPLIFYISGDGGMNKFSNSLCGALNAKGFDVIALDAKSYFWEKKTPDQTTRDISGILLSKIAGRQNQQIVFVGYSFGADVLPFVLNRLPATLHNKVGIAFIMASSGSTDFEIHVFDMFGSGKKRSMDVIPEINRLSNYEVVIISSSDDQELNTRQITLKNYHTETLPGGHHFNGDTNEIVSRILKYL